MKVYVVEWWESPSDHGIFGIYANYRTAIKAIRAQGATRRTWRNGRRAKGWSAQWSEYFIEAREVD